MYLLLALLINRVQSLLAEADFMRAAIETDLVKKSTLGDGTLATAVLYANKRYFIPFGWYAVSFCLFFCVTLFDEST